MKTFLKITFAIFLTTFSFSSFAQKTWDGGNNTSNWGDANNWNPNGVPGSTDVVSFTSDLTILVNASNRNIGKLQVSNNAVVRLRADGGNRSVTVNTAANDAITVSSGSTLILEGNSSGNRSLTLSTANTSGLVANIDGIVRVNQGGTGIGIFTKGANATINFKSGSTYNHNINGGAIPTASWANSSTCSITGLTSSDVTNLNGQSFGNFTYNCQSQSENIDFDQSFTVKETFTLTSTNNQELRLTNSANNYSITTKNFTMSGGLFFLSDDDGVGTLNVSGNFSHTAGTISEGAAGSGAIIFNGTTQQIFTSGGTVSNSINYTVNANAFLQMFSASTVVRGASFTLIAGATLEIKSADGIDASDATGNIQTTTRDFKIGANYIYSGADQSVGDGLTGALNLRLHGTGVKTFVSSSFSVNGNLTIGDSTSMIIPDGRDYTAGNLYFGTQEQLKSYWGGTITAALGSRFTGSGPTFNYYFAPSNYKAYKSAKFGSTTTGILLAGAAALPVTLSSFTAKPTPDNKVSLGWVTSTEQVNKGFRIERQAGNENGKFEQIGFVGSKAKDGNSQNMLTYNFIDAAPKVGAASFYRLVQEDLDGKLTYTEVRVVKLNGQSVSMVFPNPSNGAVNISRTADGKKMNIQVIDQSGKIISQVNNITDANYRMNIPQSGIYSIKMMYPETGEQSIQRIVVQK